MDKRSDAMTGARPGAASMIDFHAADIRGDSMGLVSKAVRATLRHAGIVLLLSSAITIFATAPAQADILSDSSHNLDDMLVAVIDSWTNALDPASQTSALLKIVEYSAPSTAASRFADGHRTGADFPPSSTACGLPPSLGTVTSGSLAVFGNGEEKSKADIRTSGRVSLIKPFVAAALRAR
jgi:hypothetical protein